MQPLIVSILCCKIFMHILSIDFSFLGWYLKLILNNCQHAHCHPTTPRLPRLPLRSRSCSSSRPQRGFIKGLVVEVVVDYSA